ncbi:hypothetical protein MX572_02065 [Rhodococcus pyridinivorans]|uniref:hypothetical protein n=1 Tax=Rhodococcus pyridinivorans TaxID=103816 RepID=UPI0020C6E7A2|nr:hypothetical protein [Rhodococcus pyridinivorans]UTM37638.1 hypothetical protein MX572_02065 [Rhodococcus pyridinivorans]
MNTFRLIYSRPGNARDVLAALLEQDTAWITNDGQYELGLLGEVLILRVPEPEETEEIPYWVPAWDVAGEVARRIDRAVSRTEIDIVGILGGLG